MLFLIIYVTICSLFTVCCLCSLLLCCLLYLEPGVFVITSTVFCYVTIYNYLRFLLSVLFLIMCVMLFTILCSLLLPVLLPSMITGVFLSYLCCLFLPLQPVSNLCWQCYLCSAAGVCCSRCKFPITDEFLLSHLFSGHFTASPQFPLTYFFFFFFFVQVSSR